METRSVTPSSTAVEVSRGYPVNLPVLSQAQRCRRSFLGRPSKYNGAHLDVAVPVAPVASVVVLVLFFGSCLCLVQILYVLEWPARAFSNTRPSQLPSSVGVFYSRQILPQTPISRVDCPVTTTA